MTHPKIGFIGLGDMGGPMAERLVEAGFPVFSCANRRRETIEQLIAKGLTECADPSEVGANAEILLSVVFDEPQTDKILRGPNGALAQMKPGGIVLLMSTLSPGYCRDLAAEAAERGITVMDCPLSGMPAGAAAGTLSLMIGGADADIDRCRDVLGHLGTVLPCGPVGAGQVMKLGNNAMVISLVGLLTELRALAEANGIEFERFKEILNQSTGRSFASEHIPLPPDIPFRHPMASKDLGFCIELAQEAGIDMAITKACLDSKLIAD